MKRWLVRPTASTVVALVMAAVPAQGQETGAVTGSVVDLTSGQPLAGAQVHIVGTTLGALANESGRYLIQQVPAGEHEVRGTLIGYAPEKHTVVVTAGGTSSQDFRLGESAIELGAVVVTATGKEQTLREIGSSVGVVDVSEVDLAPITSFTDLIQGRTAGAVVLNSTGVSGTGSRIRIRGSNSISLSNAPLLVVDGVRVESSPSFDLIGGWTQAPSALDDLNPENIESIEILKGPAASALYGTAAANGVIQVTTKRGQSGAARFRVWGEATDLEIGAEFPDNVQAVDPAFLDAFGLPCPLVYQAEGFCEPTTTYRANPLENDATTVFDGGSRYTYGASVSGGGEEATFYLSAERGEEDGVYETENWVDRWNLQANMTGRVAESLNVRGTVGFVESSAQYPQSDLASFGAVAMALYGDADPESVETTGGYQNDLEYFRAWKTFQDQSRFTSSAALDWAATSWLGFNGSAGLERISREDQTLIPRDNPFGGFFGEGFIQQYGWDIYNIHTNLSGSGVYNLTPQLQGTTTVGSQYIREDLSRIFASGAGLIPGIETSLAGATRDFSAGEANLLNSTVSAYFQQQLAFADRVFLNTAVRGDQNTSFGSDIGWIWYPSVSGSWIVSEENFFPANELLDELRLRAAYGQAGLRPGPTDAIQSFAGGVAVFRNADAPAIVIDEIGNPDLKPERSTEWEVGFETSVLSGRLGLETTYFRKTSEDALVSRPLPPSPGGSSSRFENLGQVRNSGLEFLVSGEAIRNDAFTWGLTLTGSLIDNELVDLGEDAEGNPIPPIGSGVQRFVEGYALGGYWDQPIHSFEDLNDDGLIGVDEVVVGVELPDGTIDADSVAFLGSALPTREVSLTSNLELWDLFRISTLLDYKGGHKLINYTRSFRCTTDLNCEEAFDPDTPLATQAAIVARSGLDAADTHATYAGFIEDAEFLKLRELSLSFMVPSEWTRGLRARDFRLTVAGRNLATWTDYTGLDPEVNYAGQANFTTGDYATLPPNRVLTLRVDASF